MKRSKHVRWLILFVPGTLLVIVLLFLFSRPDRAVPPKQKDVRSIRVATANIRYLNPTPVEAARFIASLDIDLLVVIEWTGQNLDLPVLLENGLVEAACKPRTGTHGICVFHQGSLHIDSSIEPAPVDGPCPMPYATVRITGNHDPVGIQAIHAPPPVTNCGSTTNATLNYHASVLEAGRLTQPMGALQKGDRAVLMGDFNAFPQSKPVGQLRHLGMQDAFTATRKGLGPTWSPMGVFPSVARIDYIWVSSDIEPLDAWVLGIPGSDHRIVVTDIKV